MVKLRMAHYNGYSLLEISLLDTRSNSRANTFLGTSVSCLLDVTGQVSACRGVMINQRIVFTMLQTSFCPISLDGCVLDYHRSYG